MTFLDNAIQMISAKNETGFFASNKRRTLKENNR